MSDYRVWTAAMFAVFAASFTVAMLTPWFLAGCALLFLVPPIGLRAFWLAINPKEAA